MTGAAPLARVVFAALVVASFAAFGVTQRLKHTPTPVQEFEHTPYFSPTPAGHNKQARISFKIEKQDDVTVAIIDSAGNEVATLIRDQPLARYTPLRLTWNGRTGPTESGPLAPEGEYRVRVSLRKQDRSVLSTWSITLVLHPHPPA